MIVKVFARLYKFTPDQVMDLTLAQVWSLLPDSVEEAIVEQQGLEKRAEHLRGAIGSLRAKTGRQSFSDGELNEELLELYGH